MVVHTLLAACAAFAASAPALANFVEPTPAQEAQAISSPIVYRGQLSYLDIPVSTSVDLRFRAYSALQDGELIGREISLEGVDLNEGAFEVVLDFGAQFAAAWIEIEVRAPSGDGDFTTLAPRQRVNQRVLIQTPDAGANGDSGGTSIVGEPGAVRQTPGSRPDASPDSGGAGLGGTGFGAGSSGAAGSVGTGADASSAGGGSRGGGWIANGSDVYFNTGNVGIGLVAPQAPLHMRDRGDKILWVINNPSGPGTGIGIQAEANGASSRALFASANSSTGFNFGVVGLSRSSRGTGVFGNATSPFGTGFGVSGVARAASGTGVRGLCTSASGTNFGIFGEVMSPDAWAGYFMGGQGAFIESGLSIGQEDSFADLSISADGAKDILEMQVSGTTVARFTNAGSLAIGTETLPPPLGILSEGSVFINTGDLTFIDEAAAPIVGSNTELMFSKDLDDSEINLWFSWYSNNGADLQMYLDDGPAGDGVNAELVVDGDVTANGFDYAELFTTGQTGLEAGDVVVMARGQTDSILMASSAYQDLLVGVVSTDPAFIAGNPVPDEIEGMLARAAKAAGASEREIQADFRRRLAEHRALSRPIALAGRVPVKVDASYGAIRAGDRLTSSATPGHAMVQTEAGPTIGVALEDFTQGQGMLTVLVQPGWYGGATTPSRVVADRDARILELEARLMALEELLLGDTP